VLLPDLFHRAGPYEPLDAAAVFASENRREALGSLMGATDNRRAARDTEAYNLERKPLVFSVVAILAKAKR